MEAATKFGSWMGHFIERLDLLLNTQMEAEIGICTATGYHLINGSSKQLD